LLSTSIASPPTKNLAFQHIAFFYKEHINLWEDFGIKLP